MKLSARRSKFVDEYLLDHNGSRAAREAGYAVSGARVTAHRLLTNVNVKAAIDLKMNEFADKYKLKKEDVIAELIIAKDLAKERLDPISMIRAWCEIGKIMGFYAPEIVMAKNLAGNEALKTKLESMSDDELMKLID